MTTPVKPLRVVFLDFDGVLNHERTKERYRRGTDGHVPGASLIGLDPRNVAVFNQFLEQAKAQIVVSSSWRWTHSLEELRHVLAVSGVKGQVLGMTRRRSMANRGLEIQDWIDSNGPLQTFVILDDSSVMGHLASRLVQTSMETGMREKHVPMGLKILSELIPTLSDALVITP